MESLTALPIDDQHGVGVQQNVANRRTTFEAALVRVKGILRGQEETGMEPNCFISYAWGVPHHERWVLKFAKDLRNAGVEVLLDRWHNPLGDDIGRFVDRIESAQYVIVVGTPELREKYASETADPVVAAELELINHRSRQPKKYGRKVIPILLADEPEKSFTPQVEKLVRSDFRNENEYFVSLLDVIWRLHDLPFDHPLLEELRESMALKP